MHILSGKRESLFFIKLFLQAERGDLAIKNMHKQSEEIEAGFVFPTCILVVELDPTE